MARAADWRVVAPLLVAGLGGGALATGGEPWVLPAVAAVAAAGLVLAVELTAARPRRAFFLGLLFGFVTNVLALGWTVGLLQRFGGFPLLAALPTAALLWAAQGLPFAVGAWLAAALRPRWPGWTLRWAPALAASCAVTPALFPWRPGAALLGWLPWVQMADLGGPTLLDLGWALLGVAAASTLRALAEGSRRRLLRGATVGLLALGLPWGYGQWRLQTVAAAREAAPRLPVGVVQPNVPIEQKHDRRYAARILATLREQTAALADQGARLVVWPESAYPYRWPRRARLAPPGRFSPWAPGSRRVPLLVGALSTAGPCGRWNSVVALDGSGRVLGLADKRTLLAFGEYVPGWHWLPPLRRFFRCPGILPGERLPLLSAADTRAGVLNCYEDLLPGAARALVLGGARWLVNVTNDAWFGRTTEPYLHHRVARLRAIETRRDLVRAVNTGVSGHVAATGEDLVRTESWTRRHFVASVALLQGRTLWVRLGEVLAPVLLGWLLALAVARRRAELPLEAGLLSRADAAG